MVTRPKSCSFHPGFVDKAHTLVSVICAQPLKFVFSKFTHLSVVVVNVVVGCWLLFVVVGCCWLLLVVVVGCCWLLLLLMMMMMMVLVVFAVC